MMYLNARLRIDLRLRVFHSFHGDPGQNSAKSPLVLFDIYKLVTTLYACQNQKQLILFNI